MECLDGDLGTQHPLLVEVTIGSWAQVHRIPVVDSQAKLVGIVTRTDIFTALETN